MLNENLLQGRIPDSEKFKNAFAMYNEDDEKRAVLNIKLSVRRNYKAKDEQYAKDDILDCKAFGKTAINIYKHFRPGDNILVSGSLQRDDSYVDKNGDTVYGSMFVNIENFYFQYAQAGASEGAAAPTAPAAKAAAPAPKAGGLRAPGGLKAAASRPAAPRTASVRPGLLQR